MKHGIVTLALALAACRTIVGVDERYAGEPDVPVAPVAPATNASAQDASAQDDDASAERLTEGGATPRRPQTLGQFRDPMLAFGEDDLLVTELGSTRSTIVRISKADPTHPTTIYDQPDASAATRVSSLGLASGQVWFTTSDGILRQMSLEGKNPTVVDSRSSSILAHSGKTLWTVAPDFRSNAPTLRWIGDALLSMVPDATLSVGGPAMFAFGYDDELIFSSRTSIGQWTLNRWRPFATQPLLTLATFDAYPSWIAADAQRVLVYGHDEGTIVSWSRVTPQTTPTVVQVGVPSPISMKSDGTNLVMRSQTSLSSCVITSCAATLKTLATPTTFREARYLEIDAEWAYFFHAKASSGPMTLVRIPR